MIGIFDSGVGGLTVVKKIREILPEYDLIYFGDTARSPYGNKSKETIVKYALEDANFLIQKGAKIIVVACNTASSLAYGELKVKYPDMPIFEVIEPAVQDAVVDGSRIGIIGTRATIGSRMYANKLGDLHIASQSCPLFVPFIEEGMTRGRELKMIAKRYLAGFKNKNIDTLILGCTHYPVIEDIIQDKVGKKVKLINSAQALAGKIKFFLEKNPKKNNNLSKNRQLKIFVSDKTTQCEKVAQKILKENVTLYESGDTI